ncbi:RteC domain-containing protein [Polluticaenibacter yanchengensis]|uniref:RteC domain-containing protein n=1 Tax=Polluticaenibacter yanchengensis TaxID=3014562 RepID=UPI00387AAC40
MKFCRTIKPHILGKIIYYNKVFQVETGCPVRNGKMFIRHFARRLKELRNEFRQSICNTDFYKYCRLGLTEMSCTLTRKDKFKRWY